MMRIAALGLALVMTALPLPSLAQESVHADEQILLKQVQTDKRALFAENLGLTEAESVAFWPVYDAYEAKQTRINDRFLALLNNYAEKYDSLSDADARNMLKEKMKIEDERMKLKQEYTKKIEKVLPPKKALRYSQIETRVEILLRRNVYGIIPLAPIK